MIQKTIIIICFCCELKAWGISLSRNRLYNMPVQINWRNFFWRTDVMRLLHISRIVRDVMLCLPWPLLKRVTHLMLYCVVYIKIRDIVVPVCPCSQFRVAQNSRTRHGFVLVKIFIGCFFPQSAWSMSFFISISCNQADYGRKQPIKRFTRTNPWRVLEFCATRNCEHGLTGTAMSLILI